MSFSAERGARERVKTWREAAEVLDLGMAAVLKVPEVKKSLEKGREIVLAWPMSIHVVVFAVSIYDHMAQAIAVKALHCSVVSVFRGRSILS